MTRPLLSACASTLLFAGCTQSGTYSEADARGGFHKIPDVLPGHQANGATYVINGLAFQYEFRAIGSGEIRDAGPTHLAPGKYKRTLYKLRKAPLFGKGRALFGGIIRRLHDADVTTHGLKSIRDRGQDTGNIKADTTPALVEYRKVNGRRWLVRTEFRDREKKAVTSRTYHTDIGGLLITLYVDFDTSFTLNSEWAPTSLDALGRLVTDFRYSRRAKPDQTMPPTAGGRTA